MWSRRVRGFTLVEVLFVLALVALITTTGAYTYRAVFSRANDRTGTVTLSGAQVDARGLASRSGYMFPGDLDVKLNATRTAPGGAGGSTAFVAHTASSVIPQSGDTPISAGTYFHGNGGLVSTTPASPPGAAGVPGPVAVFTLATSTHGANVRCVILIDDLTAGTQTWGRAEDADPATCTADKAAALAATITGEASSPTIVTLS